jgi:hypothetical protein
VAGVRRIRSEPGQTPPWRQLRGGVGSGAVLRVEPGSLAQVQAISRETGVGAKRHSSIAWIGAQKLAQSAFAKLLPLPQSLQTPSEADFAIAIMPPAWIAFGVNIDPASACACALAMKARMKNRLAMRRIKDTSTGGTIGANVRGRKRARACGRCLAGS